MQRLCSEHRPLVDPCQDKSHGNLQNPTTALSKTSPISRLVPGLEFLSHPSLRDTCGTYIANECFIPRRYPTHLCSARTLTAAVKSINGQDEWDHNRHIKTMKISNVLMVSSLLLKVGLWKYIHNHSGEESHSDATLFVLSQAIDIITHESALL